MQGVGQRIDLMLIANQSPSPLTGEMIKNSDATITQKARWYHVLGSGSGQSRLDPIYYRSLFAVGFTMCTAGIALNHWLPNEDVET
jgi:hypothetical protein